MQWAVDDVGIPMCACHGKKIDPKCVTQDAEREDSESKDRLFPWRAEEQMASNEAGDEQDEAGADAAAFLGNYDG